MQVKQFPHKLLFIQTLLFFVAVTFSLGENSAAEGGSFFSNSFMLVKIVFYGIICYCGIYFLAKSAQAYSSLKLIMKSHFFILAFIVFAMLFLPFGANPKYSFLKLVVFLYSYVALLLLLVQYGAFYKDDARRYLYKNLLIVLSLLALLPFSALIFEGPVAFLTRFRAVVGRGILHPNILASLFTYAMFLGFFYRYLQGYNHKMKTIEKYAYLVTKYIFPILIIMTFSRGALVAIILATAISLVILCVWYKSGKIFLFQLAGLTAFSLLVLLLATGIIPLHSIVSSFSRLESGADLYTLTGRTELWQFVLNQINIKSALIGNGYAVMSERMSFGIHYGKLFGAHNSYLMVFASTGLLGLTLFMLYLAQLIYRTKNASRHLDIWQVAFFLIIIFTYMIHSMVDTFFGLNLGAIFSIILVIFTYPVIQNNRLEHG